MIHIGHDTMIGKNCLIAAQVGIAGAVNIGNGVILWGQVGVSKTLTIGDNAWYLRKAVFRHHSRQIKFILVLLLKMRRKRKKNWFG